MSICNARVPACYLSQFPELVLVEGDKDAYDFKPCYIKPFPSAHNRLVYPGDQLLLYGQPVCWGDPAVEAYLTEKGLLGNEWPARNLSLSGSYRGIWADVRRISEDEPAMATIKNPEATEAQRLAAIDHIGRYVMCDGDFQDEEDEDLRDAAIYALQHDHSTEVRVRAAVVLREIKQREPRCYGDEIRAATQTAVTSDPSTDVRRELAWAWDCMDLVALAQDADQDLSVREIAALGMINYYFYPVYREAFVAIVKDPKQPLPLRAAILGALKEYLQVLEPPAEGTYPLYSSSAYGVADYAKLLLGKYGPLGNFEVGEEASTVYGVAVAFYDAILKPFFGPIESGEHDITVSSAAAAWRSPQPRPEPAGFRDHTCGVDQR